MSDITRFPELDNHHSMVEAHRARIRAILEDCSPKEVKIEEELAKLVNATARIARAFGQQGEEEPGGQQ